MKNKGLTIRLIIAAFVLVVVGITAFYIKNNIILNRSYALESTGITGISEFYDEANKSVSSASFVLSNIDPITKESIEGQKVRVYSTDDNLELSFLNAQTNDELTIQNNTITLDKNGVTVNVDGISRGNTYNIIVEPVENNKGYRPTYKSSTVTLDYTDLLSAYVSEVIDRDNNSISLSEEEKLIFLYTDDEDKIKIRTNENIDIEYTYSLTELTEEELESATFKEYDRNNYLKVSTNGYLYAKAKYQDTGWSKISSLRITNIDKQEPIVDNISITEQDTKDKATVEFSVDDAEETLEYGKSGFIKYVVSKNFELTNEDEWIEATPGNYSFVVEDNGIYYVHTMDNAGNIGIKDIDVDVITFYQPGYYVLILDSTNTDLIGKVYHTLMDMKADFDEHGLTNDDTVLAQIEGDIKNQYIDVENVNLTIDLNGYILESRESAPTFNIKSGAYLRLDDLKLDIDDYLDTIPDDSPIVDFTNGTGEGSVKNVNHDAILINEGGTLQLGIDNSPSLANIEYPDHHVPYVAGKEKAITNRGTFKYYDGVVFGGLALDGSVQDSPYIYDPSVRVSDDGVNYIMTLEKVTNVEAMIGKTRYTLLEEAIEVANNLKGTINDQIKIDIINDLNKETTVEVNDQKNILLDLNGHTFINNADAPIIDNYGKLAIMDSGDTGNITASNNNTIVNESNAELTINSGIISNLANGKNAIYNKPDATLIVNGGNVKQTNAGNAFYNDGGIVTINGGSHTAPSRGNYLWSDNIYNVLYNKDINSTTLFDTVTDIDLTDLIPHPSATTGFIKNDDGEIIPGGVNNQGWTSDAYKIIDLTDYPSYQAFKFDVTVDMNIGQYDTFYMYWRNDTGYQNQYQDWNRFAYYNQGGEGEKTFSTTLYGGQTYYIHYAFYTYNNGERKLVIKDTKLSKEHYHAGRVTINNGTFGGGQICYNNASYVEQNVINDGTFGCVYSAYTYNNAVTINGGTFNSQILNNENKTFNIKGGTISSIWNRSGTVNISGGTIGDLYNRYDYTERDYHDHLDNYAYITGGTFTGYIENYQTMDIKNATISGHLFDYSKLPMSLDTVTFTRAIERQNNDNYYSFYINASGNVDMKHINLTGNVTSIEGRNPPLYRAIYKNGSSSLTIDDLSMNITCDKGGYGPGNDGNYNVVDGIYNDGEGNIYLDNININLESNYNRFYTYGILNEGKGDIYIGKKDGNYEEERNVIKSSYQGIYSPKGLINIYDGVIKGNSIATNDPVYENETGYYIYRYDDNGVDTIKQVASIGNVLDVDNNVTYDSLGDALDAVGDTANLRFLNDVNYVTTSNTYRINAGKNITVDLNGKNVYIASLINDGTLKFIDSTDTVAQIKTQGYINNGTLNIEAGNWVYDYDKNYGVNNNGILTIKNSTHTIYSANNSENIISNNGKLYIETGAKLSVGSNTSARVIQNNVSGKLYVNAGELIATSEANNSFEGRIIDNRGGYVEINDGKITGYTTGSMSMIRNIAQLPSEYPGSVSDATMLIGNSHIAIPLDLTSYSGDVEVKVRYQYTTDYDNHSYILINETTDVPSYNTPASLLDVHTYTRDATASETVAGGKKYYMHIWGGYYSRLFIDELHLIQGDNDEDLVKHATMKINGGQIIDSRNGYSIQNYNSYIEMNNGSISSTSVQGTGIVNYRHSSFKMTGGSVTSKLTPISFYGYSYGNFEGGSIETICQIAYTSNFGIYSNEGFIDVSNIDIHIKNTDWNNDWHRSAIYLLNGSTLNMTGGTLLVEGVSRDTSAVNFENWSSGTITNSNLKGSSERGGNGVYASGENTITIGNSTVVGEGENSIGVYMNSTSNPTITFTNNDTNEDGYVSKTQPLIQGDKYGIYRKSGVFNYYDGIIKGATQIFGGVTDRPEGYELEYGNDGTRNTVVLSKLNLVRNEGTGEVYSIVQKAIDECPDDTECNLTQLYDVMLSKKITVGSKKNINYNLNELKISTTEGKFIENSGTLKLRNGTLEAQAVQNSDPVVMNNGKLYIETGAKLTVGSNGYARVIQNNSNGELYVNAGELIARSEMGGGLEGRVIDNRGGYVEINGGKISGWTRNDGQGYLSMIRNMAELPSEYPGTVRDNTMLIGNSHIAIPLDLTSYSGDVEVKVRYQYSTGYDNHSYIHINETPGDPGYNTVASMLDVHTYTRDATASETVAGGKKYYMHIWGGYYSNLFISELHLIQGDNDEDLVKHATMKINGGQIIDYGGGFDIQNYNSYLEMNNGEIKSDGVYGKGIVNYRHASFKMIGGNINNKMYPVSFHGYSYGNFEGGSIETICQIAYTSNFGIYSEEGFIDVSNIDIHIKNTDWNNDWHRSAIYLLNGSTLNMTGGTLLVEGVSRDTSAVNFENWSSGTITNSNLKGSSERGGNGVYASGENTITIGNSTVVGEGENSIGVYMNSTSNPTITFTNNDTNEDGYVSKTQPLIQGDKYGIYRKSGVFNYYDGIIKGATQIFGGVTDRPEGYELEYGNDGTRNTVVLSKLDLVRNEDTGTVYKSLQTAINECPDDTECNLTQLYNVMLSSKLTVGSKKVINYDVNEYKLSTTEGKYVYNQGTLKLTNGTLESQSVQNNDPVVMNDGKLYIETGAKLTVGSNGYARVIQNNSNGELYVNAGELIATSEMGGGLDGRVIDNRGGYVEINGGIISGWTRNDGQGYLSMIRNMAELPSEYPGNVSDATMLIGNSHIAIPLDLTGYSGDVEVKVRYEYTTGYDNHSYILINETPDAPSYNTPASLLDVSAFVADAYASETITGGKKYYMHIWGGFYSSLYISELHLIQGDNDEDLVKHATMKINGGQIIDSRNGYSIQNYNSYLEMNNGSITSTSVQGTGIANYRHSSFKMTGGSVTSKLTPISFYGYSHGKFEGGNITTSCSIPYITNYGIYSDEGFIDISDVNININNMDGTNNWQRSSIYLKNSSTLHMTGGTLLTEGTSSEVYGIYAEQYSSIGIENVSITAKTPNGGYGIGAHNYSRVVMQNGTINTTSDNGTGIYINESTKLTLGDNDGIVDKYYPSIIGDAYGIHIDGTSATFKYYDGRIKSKGTHIQGVVNDIPQDYQTVIQGNNCFLEIASSVENTFEYNGTYFENINMPIEIIKRLDDKTGTIKVWNGFVLTDQLVIPEGVNITLALEGHQIDVDESLEVGIVNNGTLTIIDGIGDEIDEDTESFIINNHGVAIENNGTLTIGASNNPNRRSPKIKGTTGVTGNNATLLSGQIESTEGGILQTVGAALARLFTFDIAESSYSYKTATYQVNNLPDNTILATSPTYKAVQSLDTWTKDDIDVGIASHNIGILNLVAERNPVETKEIEYTVEVYKNGVLDEFYTFKKIINVQYLEDNTLDVDLDYFEGAETKFKEYYLNRMTINDVETTDIPINVEDGTTFKLYYGQTKGEEIELNNPKTGRKSYKIAFLIALIATIAFISFLMSRYIKRLQIKEDTI